VNGGEFTREELTAGEGRSDLRWVYHTLEALPGDERAPCFGQLGIDFSLRVNKP